MGPSRRKGRVPLAAAIWARVHQPTPQPEACADSRVEAATRRTMRLYHSAPVILLLLLPPLMPLPPLLLPL